MDILSYMDQIPICAHYMLNGAQTDEFPFPSELADATPVITYMPGWKCDISGVREYDKLPKEARNYVDIWSGSWAAPSPMSPVGRGNGTPSSGGRRLERTGYESPLASRYASDAHA